MPAPAVESAFEQGVNYFHWDTFRRGPPHRDRLVLVIQSYA